jgi:penicillin-binding protein 1A
VWVGKDNVEPLGRNETGSRTAIPIWLEFMKNSLINEPIYNFPTSSETMFVKVDPATGNIADSKNPKGFFEIFKNDNLPKKNSQYRESVITENF